MRPNCSESGHAKNCLIRSVRKQNIDQSAHACVVTRGMHSLHLNFTTLASPDYLVANRDEIVEIRRDC